MTPRLVALLTVEPLLLLAALAVPATHDLVRLLDPADVRRGRPYFVSAGPLFWVHLAYLDVLMLGATAAFIVSLLRRSRAYGVQAAVLTGAALLPWVTNLGYNFDIAPLADRGPHPGGLHRRPRSWPGACSASTCCASRRSPTARSSRA